MIRFFLICNKAWGWFSSEQGTFKLGYFPMPQGESSPRLTGILGRTGDVKVRGMFIVPREVDEVIKHSVKYLITR